MGNIIGISVDIPCDQAVSACCSCFGKYNNYVHNLEENVENLNNAKERLTGLRDDVTTRVSVCENNGLQPLATVQVWLSRVAEIDEQVSTILQQKDQELDSLCICSYCSKNCITSYKYGKRVVKKLAKLNDLISEGDFLEVGQEGPRPIVDERPIEPTVGLDVMVNEVWSSMMENTISRLGLYGMGGVGKTTLLTLINNKCLTAPTDFHIVIWVSVSKEVQIERIQDDIGKKLGLSNERWEGLREDEKAVDIFNKLRQKKFVLLLDDIWTQLDLKKIGVPVPDENNGCKIVFSTRFQDICGLMEADRAIEVECLEWNDAWELFRMKAGIKTLEKNDARIVEWAQRIARKCQGLPLALTTIGVSMRSKKKEEEWENALDDLTTSMARSKYTTDKDNAILPLLKFSFDAIKDEKTQSSFLFCALLPEDYAVERDDLVDYWICEGILDGFGDRDRAYRRGYEIIQYLVSACLLIEDGSRNVKMHSMIRKMGLWVASDSKRDTDYSVVQTHGGRDYILKVENPMEVTRMLLMNNKIVNFTSFGFPKLKTLIAPRNESLVWSKVFQSLESLKVLDLSGNKNLGLVPKDISKLVELEYLNLSRTSIRRLPESFRELVKLKYLNLEYVSQCGDISAVSSLHNLQTLRLYGCGFFLKDSSGSVLSLQTLKELKHLKVLTIRIKGADALEMLVNFHRLTNSVRRLSVYYYRSNSLEISSMTKMSSLESLVIYFSSLKEIKVDVQTAQKLRKLSGNIIFRYLYSVTIQECPNLKHLTWLLLAPNLNKLNLYMLAQLEEVIREDKIDSIIVDQPLVLRDQPFQKLKHLTLSYMPKLRSIYATSLPFPCLEHIKVVGCPKLKKLPLNSESANKDLKLVIQGSEEWIRNIEWEDEATKCAFTLSC